MRIRLILTTIIFLVGCSITLAQSNDPASSANLEEQSKKLAQEEEELLRRVQGLQKQNNPKSEQTSIPSSVTPQKIPVEPAENSKQVPARTEDKLTRAEKKLTQVCGCSPEALAASQDRVKKLTTDLEEARNRLLLSETEVERLAKIVDERIKGEKSEPSSAQLSNKSIDIQPKVARDLPIATVSVAQAQLRSAPEKSASIISTATLGTRLAVETRTGSWYRIISPNGSRAWISADMIDFGSNRAGSAAKSKGIERESF